MYLLTALHGLTELKSLCRAATGIPTKDEETSSHIKQLALRHLRLMKLVSTAQSIFELAICSQILTSLGFLVVVPFQMDYGIDYCDVMMVCAALIQPFYYCFLSECIYHMVRTIFFRFQFDFEIDLMICLFLERRAQVLAVQLKMVRNGHCFSQENPAHAIGDGQSARIYYHGSLAIELGILPGFDIDGLQLPDFPAECRLKSLRFACVNAYIAKAYLTQKLNCRNRK